LLCKVDHHEDVRRTLAREGTPRLMARCNAARRPSRAGAGSRRRSSPGTRCCINPFYPKDPHASFGKHVLTPTLALTSFAATTPPPWRVEYWDENLLHGPPPRIRYRRWSESAST
jgi:hypothetical protein